MVLSNISTAISVLKSSSPMGILAFLQTTGYFILFIVMIFEGPIITYAAAFAASLGVFNIFYIFILSFLGNVVGDLIFFFIGRIGKRYVIDKYVSHWLKEKRIEKIRDYLKNNPGKTIVAIKLTPPLPAPGLILAGASEMSFKIFMIYSSIVSASFSIFLTALGFYSGVAFNTIANNFGYIELIIPGVIILTILVFILVRYLSKKISNRIERI
jgi:membrane protein DedA with SNARE-associated domain